MGSIARSSFQSPVFTSCDRLPAVLQTIHSTLQIKRASPNWKHGWKIPGALYWHQVFTLKLERSFIQMQKTFLFSLCIKHNSFHYLRKEFVFKIIFFAWTVESKHDDSVSFIPAMFFRFDKQYLPTHYLMDNKQKPNNKQENGSIAALFIAK